LQEKLGGEEFRSAHALTQLNDERDAHNSTQMTLKNEREINVDGTHQHSAHGLSLQDDIDGMQSNSSSTRGE
jgi:hypothetical protein